jgi:hypothetical protein
MAAPKISVLLCTVRGAGAYVKHPEWDVLQKVIDDLEAQTFKDFELVIVDGLYATRAASPVTGTTSFPVVWIPPRQSYWVQHRKVAICAYRNTGIAAASGDLVVNLDDCCELPPHYLEMFAAAWEEGYCLATCWPDSGDSRRRGLVKLLPDGTTLPRIYGFGSYPREVALRLNGYDEAYDGSQGLEDVDWSSRLARADVKMALEEFDGFKLHMQSFHDGRCIDLERPVVKCCNCAWQLQRVRRRVGIANVARLWDEESMRFLRGPCQLLRSDHFCGHHNYSQRCPFLPLDLRPGDESQPLLAHGFALYGDPLADKMPPPVLDLRKLAEEIHNR